MNNKPTPSSPSRALRHWVDWCDGFWIGFCFIIATLLSFTIPIAVLKRVANAVGEGTPRHLVILLGTVVIAIAGPIILSKVYRELEYPGTRKQRAMARPVEPELATPEL